MLEAGNICSRVMTKRRAGVKTGLTLQLICVLVTSQPESNATFYFYVI